MIDQPLLDRVKKQAWFHRYPRGWPLLLFLIAGITTAVSVMAIERADRQTRQVELDRNLTEISSALQRRVTENMALLRAGAALFATQSNVSEDQFRNFAQDLQGSGRMYGSLGMGWAPLLTAEQVPFFEVAVRQSPGGENYSVNPVADGSLPYSVPILFLEPQSEDNQRAVGFDMYSEAVRRAAIDRARAARAPVASGKVKLVQDSGHPDAAGFLIYMPVIKGKGRSAYIKGFLYSPFRAEEFLNSASELYRNNRIDVAIYDRSVDPQNLMAERTAPGSEGPTMERRIDVGGEPWVVVVSDRQYGALSPLARVTLFFGIIASLAVMGVGRLITYRAAEDRKVLEWLQGQAAIRDSLTRELNHRVKNTLANVLSIAALTRRRATDLDDFTESLSARIRALSATHDLLSQSDWTSAALSDVIEAELAPYMEGNENHVERGGPDIKLAPNDAMSLGLAIHELATNAAKYGALSTIEGRVHIHWKMVSDRLAQINWREEGGPRVSAPSKRGFGRDLIEKVVAHELKSAVDLRFEPEGVECTLRVPVRTAREFALRSERR